jgi:STE24 endopeptidase
MRGRGVAAGVAGLGLLLIALLAWRFVPWEPVAGGFPDPASPGSVFSQAEIGRSEDYSARARLLGWSSYAVSLVLVAVLGFSAAGRQLMGRVRGRWWWRVVVAVVIVQGVVRLVTLPWSLAARANRLEFGLTRQPLSEFLSDLATGFALQAGVTTLAILVIVGSARRWCQWWPAIAGVALGVLTLIASFAYPVVIEPLFNEFESLAPGPVRAEVLALARAEGVPLDDVLVADASRRTTSLNAYVSGFGATRRVVLYDTLVASVPPDQIAAVVAHELAHAKHDDVLVGSLLGALGVLMAVGVLGLILPADPLSPPMKSPRWGRPGVGDPAVVPLVLALAAMAALIATPVQNTISRRVEIRADVVALAATGDAEAAEDLQRSLALGALSDPTPPRWSHLWFGSHPTALERIALSRSWAR